MTGDHHGRTARRATLLVTATDEILGTYNVSNLPFGWHAGWLFGTPVVDAQVSASVPLSWSLLSLLPITANSRTGQV
jgi:hypothetical protein